MADVGVLADFYRVRERIDQARALLELAAIDCWHADAKELHRFIDLLGNLGQSYPARQT